MNKAKNALYEYQRKNFPAQSHLICDFNPNAYPETAQGVELLKMARFIRVSPKFCEPLESLRQRIFERLARPTASGKEKSKAI